MRSANRVWEGQALTLLVKSSKYVTLLQFFPIYPDQWFSHLVVSELPGGLVKTQIMDPLTPIISDSVGLTWSLRFCIFNRLPGDPEVSWPGDHTLRTADHAIHKQQMDVSTDLLFQGSSEESGVGNTGPQGGQNILLILPSLYNILILIKYIKMNFKGILEGEKTSEIANSQTAWGQREEGVICRRDNRTSCNSCWLTP